MAAFQVSTYGRFWVSTEEHGRVTIGETVRLTSANRNTLKTHFRRLVELGHLKQYGVRKGTWYGLP